MKKVLFVRHGKSSWDYEVADKDRPLKERGINDAHLIGKQLKTMGIKIERSYSSPANRALHTAMIVLRNLNFDFLRFRVNEELYDFSGDSVLQFLKTLDNDFQSVLIFGHNYAFTSLVNSLGDEYIDNLPTAGMAIIEFDCDSWSDISKGKTQEIIVPKQLK